MGMTEDPASGWVEGAAILAAVLIVGVVSATNDFSAQTQFEALNAQEKDIAVRVIRSKGQTMEVPLSELVVGDVIVLESGDKVRKATAMALKTNSPSSFKTY